MKSKLYLMFCIILLVATINLVSAESSYIYQQNTEVDIKIPVFNSDNSKADNTISCYITVKKPNEDLLLDDVAMSFNTGGYFNKTIVGSDLTTLGEYPVSIRCDDGTNFGFSTFKIQITPTGAEQTSILNNPMIIVFIAIGACLIALGIFVGIPWFGFIGAIMFLLGGIYTMIYGFNNITDFYSRGIGLTLIGLGFIFMFSSAYEWLSGGDAGED